jgi:hypothetical protein
MVRPAATGNMVIGNGVVGNMVFCNGPIGNGATGDVVIGDGAGGNGPMAMDTPRGPCPRLPGYLPGYFALGGGAVCR